MYGILYLNAIFLSFDLSRVIFYLWNKLLLFSAVAVLLLIGAWMTN